MSALAIFHICPFNLHPEKWFEGYPVKSTQICRVPPRLDFSIDFFLIFKYETQLFQAGTLKKPVRSYPKKISNRTLEKSGRSGKIEKSWCRLNRRSNQQMAPQWYKIWVVENLSKRSSNTLLRLVRFSSTQTLVIRKHYSFLRRTKRTDFRITFFRNFFFMKSFW